MCIPYSICDLQKQPEGTEVDGSRPGTASKELGDEVSLLVV